MECTGLAGITIPASVTNIEFHAFFGCTNLTRIYFCGDAPAVGEGVFDKDNQLTVYHSPDATGWKSTFAGRPAVAGP
jgi:hypothetical protein